MKTEQQKQESSKRRSRNRSRGDSRSYPRVRARPILPGTSYKVTRRCHERRLYLTPGSDPKKFNNFVGYCLAYVANKCKIKIHACVVMSNHYHADVSDPHGNIVEFKQRLHSLLSRGVNALRGRFDGMWSAEKACDTPRPTEEETLGDLIYTLTNPVKDGLVKWGHQWPGFTTHGWLFGESRSFKRPNWFFDPDGEMPESVTLTLERPSIYPELSDAEFQAVLFDAVRTREVQLQKKRRESGQRFMGVAKLLRQRWNSEPGGYDERFRQAPRAGTANKWIKIADARRNRVWERAYALARERLLAGVDAVFPAGTYWLHRFAGVTVEKYSPP